MCVKSQTEPLRILHVVGRMNRAGIQTWLMHVLRNVDRHQYQMDFLVHTPEPGEYDSEIRALGSRLIVCDSPYKPWLFARQMRRALRMYGPYDIVHSHLHHFSGNVLWLARLSGVQQRIAHSHSDTSLADSNASMARRWYLRLMHWLISQHATLGLAGSRKAASALFGPRWEALGSCRVLYYGIDLMPYHQLTGPSEAREELEIPQNAFVVGHVGRFAEPKNHMFLIKIARALTLRHPSARLLLVGDGPLRSAIEAEVATAGLQDRVIFTGVRADVPRLLGAMDVFVLPSLWEGLPLVGIEAQASGRSVVMSDRVTHEVDIVPGLVQHLSLNQPVDDWVMALTRGKEQSQTTDHRAALAAVEHSPFSIRTSVGALLRYYDQGVNGADFGSN